MEMYLKQHIRSIVLKCKHYLNEYKNKEIFIFFFCKLLLPNRSILQLSFIVFIGIYKINILNTYFFKLTLIIKSPVLLNLIIVIYEKFDINSTCKV